MKREHLKRNESVEEKKIMSDCVRRGFVPTDEKEFSGKKLEAVRLILETLDELKVRKANMYLDAPVSNSGRLKQLFLACGKAYDVNVEVQVENSVDSLLSGMRGVVSTDAIILNQCQSWVNLGAMITQQKIPESWCVAINA